MKTHLIVYVQNGGTSFSEASPHCVLEAFNDDFDETVEVCYSNDDFRLVFVAKYHVRSVPLPDYLPPERFARDTHVQVGLKWIEGFGLDPDVLDTLEEFERLIDLPEYTKWLACELLMVKQFRSNFRASLASQLRSWLAGETGYNSPWSRRQVEALGRYTPRWKVENRSKALYRDRRERGTHVKQPEKQVA